MRLKLVSGVLLACSLIALTGCKPSDDKAKELVQAYVKSMMKDPDSVMFKDLSFVGSTEGSDGTVSGNVCGRVNAKNSLGGYVGFKTFFASIEMKSKGTFSTGVTYTISNAVLEPDSYTDNGHALNNYQQVYRTACKQELHTTNE